MIAVILSAGAGSRLLPLTEERPKCLVEVGGRSILDWQIDALHAAGVDRIVVVGGYRHAQITAHLRARQPAVPAELIVNPFWSVASSIGSVWEARAYLDRPFCLLNGDTVFEPALLAAMLAHPAPGVSLVVEPLAALVEDDMLVSVADDRVSRVAKNLSPTAATHRSLGIVISSDDGARYRGALDAVITADGGHQAYHHDIVDHLARHDMVTAAIAGSAAWQEIDRPEDIDRWTASHPRSAT